MTKKLVSGLGSILLCGSFLAAQSRFIENSALRVDADGKTGAYTIRSKENGRAWMTATVAAEVNHRWLHARDYPKHVLATSSFSDDLGSGTELMVTYSGLAGQPDLIGHLRSLANSGFVEIEVQVKNSTASQVMVQSIRAIEGENSFFALDGPDAADRVLSDSFSEDRPNMELHDLSGATDGMHRAVGSQLIYNRQSHQSLFVGALTSEKLLTVLRLHVDASQNRIKRYEVDSTGSTELAKENSLKQSAPEYQIELSLPLDAGQSMPSERLVVGFSSDYHAQLERYGDLIRKLHNARVNAPTPMGWWSWTAYYFGLTEGPARTNAEFLSQHLREYGYTFFHIDEGYQFARGDYSTVTANKFPHGMKELEQQVQELGLTPGIWTAPFEVAERSFVYVNHKNWLVHTKDGRPIPAGWVTEPPDTGKKLDQLYMLDTTNPAAQQYMREIYRTLVRDWGIRYIKLDFMDDSLIEGYYYRPNTTALEAQRIGLKIIRDAVGENVLLDKDGSAMLNPVGLVDLGRISCDTGHTFEASRDAAPGIAARYYMNRNYFVADPDAFSVSDQAYAAQENHGGDRTLTLSEAQVGIALAAVSGGMIEVGDDLPTLFLDPERMALLKNRDIVNTARLGRSAKPLDLMSYAPEDEMPSEFLLRESKRQSILTVFNWTDKERRHSFDLTQIVLNPEIGSHSSVVDVFSGEKLPLSGATISLTLAPHSVRMLKIVDTSVAASAPSIDVQAPKQAVNGQDANFAAISNEGGVPAISYHWDFGDGTNEDGAAVSHSYTHTGTFNVNFSAEGIEGVQFEKTFPVNVRGTIDTVFRPEQYVALPAEH